MMATESNRRDVTSINEAVVMSIWFRILKWVCPDHLFEEIEGDLLQRFQRDVKVSGLSIQKAKRRLIWNTVLFLRPGILVRNMFVSPLGPYSLSNQLNFQRVSNISGWFVFIITFVVYFLTVEETASYWDCGEFIAASYKLQVPHPPGAPLFLLVGRMFSFLSFGEVKSVAYAINMMSVLASAFTILFLFWSIVLTGRKLIDCPKNCTISEEKVWLIMGSGAVGALAYAFSDSFWFSAVEGEVYAMSSFFTAFVVWAVLKWNVIEDASKANRWLLLIAYMIGLSIGVHLLNLLTLPALALIYYFKSYKFSFTGFIVTMVVSIAIVLFINDFIVPGLPTIAGNFELFFVNSLGLFFGSGAIVFFLLIVGVLVYGIHFTQRGKYALANTMILALTFILIGYGSYSMVIIRSNYDTLINENAPKDIMSFVRYLKREQYGSRPLLYGPYFTADPIAYEYGDVVYVKGKDKYEVSQRKVEVSYNRKEETFMPRTWYSDQKDDYERIIGLKPGQQPSTAQNISYMFHHQIGTMYLRYFFWNFAGRESDEDGADWLKPTEWFKDVPAAISENKARNNYFMIPLLLGLIGMGYQYVKDRKNFAVIGLLFVMLGVAIVVYLNSPPTEPRERDYIYVGSYYAFAFWIGLAVIALADIANHIYKNRKAVVIIASFMGFAAPAIMIHEGWNDHDRSDRFFSIDSASNTLESCDPNGILFTGGDNDTFPLWYAQEVEGCRTDLRALVLTYCNSDWYIHQTTLPAYESTPFSYTLSPKQYSQGGPNDPYLQYVNTNIPSMDAKEYLRLIARDYKPLLNGDNNVLPSKVFTIPVDKEAVLEKGIIPKGMENLIVDHMEIKMKKNILLKGELAFLDLLVTSNWERPIYLNNNTLNQLSFDLSPYLVQEGNVFRVLPVANPRKDRDYLVDTDKTYDLMLNKFAYRGLDDSSIYYTEDYKIPVLIHRSNLNSLAQSLLDKGKLEEANKVLSFSFEKMPYEVVPYDPSTPDTVSLLFQAGQREKAIEVTRFVGEQANEMASYLVDENLGLTQKLRLNVFILGSLQRTLYENGEMVLAKNFEDKYEALMAGLQSNMDRDRQRN